MLRTIDPLPATAWAVLGGALVLAAVRRLGGRDIADRRRRSRPRSSLAIVYAGALAAGIANVFVFNAIRLVGPTRVDARPSSSSRSGAVLLGRGLLDEPIGLGQLVGGVVIVLGVWLTRRPTVLPRVADRLARARRDAR